MQHVQAHNSTSRSPQTESDDEDDFVINEFYYGNLSFISGKFDFLSKALDGCRSIHLTRAASMNPSDVLSYAEAAACSEVILSDKADARIRVDAISSTVRSCTAGLVVDARTVDLCDYWSARSCPRSDLVVDIGNIMQDPDPSLVISRLVGLSKRYVLLVALVLPARPDGLLGEDAISAAALMYDRELAKSVMGAYSARGVNSAHAVSLTEGARTWKWHFTPAALRELGESAGLVCLRSVPVWSDIAIAMLFETRRHHAR